METDLNQLTEAQRQTASEVGWYRDWLLSTGRAAWQVDPKPPEPENGYVGYRCRRSEHSWCRGRWGDNHCTCPCHGGGGAIEQP